MRLALEAFKGGSKVWVLTLGVPVVNPHWDSIRAQREARFLVEFFYFQLNEEPRIQVRMSLLSTCLQIDHVILTAKVVWYQVNLEVRLSGLLIE